MQIKKTVAIAAATGLLTALALPALADTTFYGSIRTSASWDTLVLPKAQGNTTLFNEGNDATSRLGVNGDFDKLKFNIELGIGDAEVYNTAQGAVGAFDQTGWISSGGGLTAVYTRHAYGTYKFDAGTLLVGQTWDPYTILSAQALNGDQAGCYFGALYDGRMPQIKFTLNNGFYIDLIRQTNQETTATTSGGNVTSLSGSATSSTANVAENPSYKGLWEMPKIAIGYDGKTGNYTYGGGFLGQTYKNAEGVSVNSGMIYAHGKAVVDNFDVLANVSAGLNVSGLGIKEGGTYLETGKTNVTTVTALVSGGYKVTPTVKVNAGIGGGTSSSDKGLVAHPTLGYLAFANSVVTLAKNVFVTPEIDYIDSLKSSSAEGAYTGYRNIVYGAQFRLDF